MGVNPQNSPQTEGRGRPGGLVVKFMCSTSAACGSQVWIPGADLVLAKPHCGSIPHKIEKDRHRRLLSDNLPLVKRGGLATDVSSGQSASPKKKKRASCTGGRAPGQHNHKWAKCGSQGRAGVRKSQSGSPGRPSELSVEVKGSKGTDRWPAVA